MIVLVHTLKLLLIRVKAVVRKIAFQQDKSFRCGNVYLFGSLTDHFLIDSFELLT